MRFRAEQHLRRQNDFRQTRENGRRRECGGFTLWYYRRPGALPDSSPLPSAASAAPAAPAASHGSPAEAPAPGAQGGTVPVVHGPRVGVIASTAAVGCAVKRSRAKRRLREVFRHHQNLVPADIDLLLIARHALNALEYREIEQKFVEACRKLFPPAP